MEHVLGLENLNDPKHGKRFEGPAEYFPLSWIPTCDPTKSEEEQDEFTKDVRRNYSYVINYYVYDSANHGSVCRLFNHKCEDDSGSMVKYQLVHTQRQDSRLPNIAFFTIRDIKKGEEITWDYGLTVGDKMVQKKNPCFCQSPKCRGYLMEYVRS